MLQPMEINLNVLLVIVLITLAFASNDIYVQQIDFNSSVCSLRFQDKNFKCSLGVNGVTTNKREGDGCTPVGSFPLRQVFFRADKIGTDVNTYLDKTRTKPNFGWCDDPENVYYNQFVQLPFSYSHENLWLTDSCAYDLLAVIGYNDDPIVKGLGSAIFFHVTEDYGPTAGCVALSFENLKYVLANIDPYSLMHISVK